MVVDDHPPVGVEAAGRQHLLEQPDIGTIGDTVFQIASEGGYSSRVALDRGDRQAVVGEHDRSGRHLGARGGERRDHAAAARREQESTLGHACRQQRAARAGGAADGDVDRVDEQVAGDEHDLLLGDLAVAIEAERVLPQRHRILGRLVELLVDHDLAIRVEPERDEVGLQLTHVGTVACRRRQVAPRRDVTDQRNHRSAVDGRHDRAGLDDGALSEDRGDGAGDRRGDRRRRGEAERRRRLFVRGHVLLGDLDRRQRRRGRVGGRRPIGVVTDHDDRSDAGSDHHRDRDDRGDATSQRLTCPPSRRWARRRWAR